MRLLGENTEKKKVKARQTEGGKVATSKREKRPPRQGKKNQRDLIAIDAKRGFRKERLGNIKC